MSSLYAKARTWASRLLVMFQHFRFWISPSGRVVHCSVFKMSITSLGDCVGRFGTAFTCLTRCSEVIASSCSRRRRRGLLGTTLPSCRIQWHFSAGGGIRAVHRVTEGSL